MERRQDWLFTVLVVLESLELFVVTPLTAKAGVPFIVQFALVAAIAAIVLAVVVPSRAAVAAVIVSLVVEGAAAALRSAPSQRTEALDFAAALIAMVALTVVLGIAVFGPGQVTIHRIVGAVAIYLNVALAFAFAYRLIDAEGSNAFNLHGAQAEQRIADFVYFSFTTLTTAGYGDIVPVDPFARSLATLESVIGQLFPATVLARLITLELEARRGS